MILSKSEAGKLGWLASKTTQKKKKQQRIEEYYKNPTICLCCGKTLNYKHRHNKFCGKSCSASYNNVKTKKKNSEIKTCIVCGKELHKHQVKYCCKECEIKNKKVVRFENHISDNGDIVGCTEYTARRIAKDYLEEKYGHKCMICGTSEWLGKPILLISDHIDGDPTHNNINNFRIICSNCDATLDTYKNKNKIKKKRFNRK